MQVQINLKHIKNKEELLREFGDKLEFGGPNGNVPVTRSVTGKGWGMNWDAMMDCLRSLEEGGIWGMSKKFDFPLKLVLMNYEDYARRCPEDFQVLAEILEHTAGFYAEAGQVFEYELA